MPLKRCLEDKKPGWKWGDSGKCYIYTSGDETSEKAARKKALNQGIAIGDIDVNSMAQKVEEIYLKSQELAAIGRPMNKARLSQLRKAVDLLSTLLNQMDPVVEAEAFIEVEGLTLDADEKPKDLFVTFTEDGMSVRV